VVQQLIGRLSLETVTQEGADSVQGVVKMYDPATRDGVIITDVDLAEYNLAPGALEGSVFRMLRPGQRVVFDLDSADQATGLRLGSEVDMGTPSWLESNPS
jgi:CspA family cold shock protein